MLIMRRERVGHMSNPDSTRKGRCVDIVMEGSTNIVVYHNSEIIRNTCGVLCIMTFTELQYSLCQNIESDIDFDIMSLIDEAIAYEIQHDLDMEDDRDKVYKGMNSDSEKDHEAPYEASNEDKHGDRGGRTVVENIVVPPAVSQPMVIPAFMRNLDLDTMHASKFSEYANIGVADPKDREFRIGMEYSSRKSVVVMYPYLSTSADISGVYYFVYEFKPQTFYAKYKTYDFGYDWLIRAILIWKKDC
ncbi:hypothetical protein Ahy_B05g077786 [Arachis hypogaea]|uniref:Transposase MuDR plant domain-containing protein n=1 Tax=Arachis hypogaea TaxID=3818 RepID=A0A444Z5H7_ARAHY|nr:hypothetical protein Ahy_B05g077786 [Arachis hypogaea]